MTNKKDLTCFLCDKAIEENDDVLLGGKDDIEILPVNANSSNIVFIHSECFKKYLEDKEKNDR